MVLYADPLFTLLKIQDLPLLGGFFILVRGGFINILIRGYSNHLLSQPRGYLTILGHMRYNTPQRIISLQQIVLNRRSNLIKHYPIGIQDLQHLQHIEVLVENVLR